MKLLVFVVRNRLEGKSILIPRIRKEFTSHSAPSEKNGALESPVSSSQTERKRECGCQVSPAARSMSKCPRFTYMLHARSPTTQRKGSRQPGTQKVSICNWKQTKLVLGEMFPGKCRDVHRQHWASPVERETLRASRRWPLLHDSSRGIGRYEPIACRARQDFPILLRIPSDSEALHRCNLWSALASAAATMAREAAAGGESGAGREDRPHRYTLLIPGGLSASAVSSFVKLQTSVERFAASKPLERLVRVSFVGALEARWRPT
jgi:hypothetical protein